MKKVLALLLVVSAIGFVIGGCNKGADDSAAAPATTAGAAAPAPAAGGTAGAATPAAPAATAGTTGG